MWGRFGTTTPGGERGLTRAGSGSRIGERVPPQRGEDRADQAGDDVCGFARPAGNPFLESSRHETEQSRDTDREEGRFSVRTSSSLERLRECNRVARVSDEMQELVRTHVFPFWMPSKR